MRFGSSLYDIPCFAVTALEYKDFAIKFVGTCMVYSIIYHLFTYMLCGPLTE